MNFWDSSAIVALIVDEPLRQGTRRILDSDPRLAVWWGTSIECVAAVARREREKRHAPEQTHGILGRLDELAAVWDEVQPDVRLRALARRLVRVHPLKAADGLQLAAALVAAEDEPGSVGFVSFDQRLNEAAAREGFSLRVSE